MHRVRLQRWWVSGAIYGGEVMLGETCSHGIKWGDECKECQLVWDRETVRRWKPIVDEAERRIAEFAGTDGSGGEARD